MKWLFLLFFLPFSLTFGLTLKEKFLKASPGTFIVTEQNKTTTLLHVHSKTDEELLLEEISIPAHLAPSNDWHTWVAKGAEGHTCWILYAFDLKENQISECYSFTRGAHLQTDQLDAFFLTLLNLELDLLPENERLQTGATSRPGQVSLSKPWGPPMIKEGKKVSDPAYSVYKATWPVDQTELSGKKLVFYFDETSKDFPFPYWMQAREGGLKFKIRACDSGRSLSSPQRSLPRRTPFFMGNINKTTLTLSAPLYYHDFKLYAVDISSSPRTTHSFPCAITREKETVKLELDPKILQETLTPGHQYIWLATSEEHDVYIEMEHPWVY